MHPTRSRSWAAAIAGLIVATLPARAGGVIETDHWAPSHLLGRPIHFTVYKPAPEPPPGQRWPVLFLFHGLSGGDRDWLDGGRVAATLDRAIAAGRIQPMMVVMPMAGDSWYVDNADPGAAGPIAQAFKTDLIAAVDAAFPTAACREARAVGGLSMGGYGALLHAFDRPDLYRAVISLSGSIFPEMSSDPAERSKRRFRMFGKVFGDPFDWRRFNAWNLFPRAAQLSQSPQKPAIWLQAGDDDFPSIVDGTVRMHLALKEAGIESELRIDNGGHEWRMWRDVIASALEWVSPRLDPTCRQPGPVVSKTGP